MHMLGHEGFCWGTRSQRPPKAKDKIKDANVEYLLDDAILDMYGPGDTLADMEFFKGQGTIQYCRV
jgi:hypothetical protein